MHRWLPILAARRLAGCGPALVGVRMTEHQKHGGWRPGGGRPPLPDELRRSKQTKVMWTEDELACVDRAVAELNYSGRADLIRDLVLEAIERRTRIIPYLGGGDGEERLLDP